MERFLLKESWASALRAAAYAGNDYVLLAKARIAVTQQAGDAQKALDNVPASLRSDRSYFLATVQFLRRQEKVDEAAKVLAGVAYDALVGRRGPTVVGAAGNRAGAARPKRSRRSVRNRAQ